LKLTPGISRHNYYSLLWHAFFLALAQNFMDVDTVIPAMLIEAGGNGIHIGLMTAIMLGGSSFTQLIFAPFISNYPYKKKFLLVGINARITSLLCLGLILYFSIKGAYIIWLIFLLITFFSLGGAFANVSYTDILGKSIDQSTRKSFFSVKQVVGGVMLLFSALLAKKVITLEDFPLNYAYMFLIGFLALFIASLGFWQLKEGRPSRLTIKSPGHFLSLIKTELTQRKKLAYFLGFINTMGVSITLLPFIMLYAKDLYHTQSQDTGLFLLAKVIGSVVIGFMLFIFNKKFKYRYLLYGNVFLVLSIPLFLLISPGTPSFVIIFLIGGIILSIYLISMNGVLLEISETENRTLYTGIAGAGNIIPAIFPILGGMIIERTGYQLFFVLFMFIVLLSLFFVYKLDCRK
jgi:MFS family permease